MGSWDLAQCPVRRGRRPRRPYDVPENGSCLNRGQLLVVTHEHQAGVGTDRLDQAGHQWQRHHGRLVDHDDIVGQAVVAIVAEAVTAGRQAPEQAMDSRGFQGEQTPPHLIGHIEPAGLGVDGFGHARRRLAGRRGQRHQRWRPADDGSLLFDQA